MPGDWNFNSFSDLCRRRGMLCRGRSAFHCNRRVSPWSANMAVSPASPPDHVDTNSHDPLVLISFDVDGTLMSSTGATSNFLHKAAFTYGFQRVFDIDTHIDVIKHHGGTDPLIAVKVLEHHGVDKEEAMKRLKDMEAAMIEYYQEHESQQGVGLCLLPGVEELLSALKSLPNVVSCLVTGNLEPIGWGKMKALGLYPLFSQPVFGGFGTDFCSGNTEEMWHDRAEFLRIAQAKCKAFHPEGIRVHYHVGDTPMDIQAALAAGAIPVGVATGIYTLEELAQSAACSEELVLLRDLSDLQLFLKELQLEVE